MMRFILSIEIFSKIKGLPWEFVGDRAACFGYTDS